VPDAKALPEEIDYGFPAVWPALPHRETWPPTRKVKDLPPGRYYRLVVQLFSSRRFSAVFAFRVKTGVQGIQNICTGRPGLL